MVIFDNAKCKAEEYVFYFMQTNYHIMYTVRPLTILGLWTQQMNSPVTDAQASFPHLSWE